MFLTFINAIIKIIKTAVPTIWSKNEFQCGTPFVGIVKNISAVPVPPATSRTVPSNALNKLQ